MDHEGAFDAFQDFVATLQEACKIYIIVKSTSDEEELEFNQAVRGKIPNFEAHRILHYQTQPGHTAFIRQLCPHLHIEQDIGVYNAIKPHIHNIWVHKRSGDGSSYDAHTFLAYSDLMQA